MAFIQNRCSGIGCRSSEPIRGELAYHAAMTDRVQTQCDGLASTNSRRPALMGSSLLPRKFRSSWLTWVFLAVFAPILLISAKAQISPGPLSQAHQSLNGASNCTKCHSVSTSSPTFRCLDCHQPIAAELNQHKGLHATFPQAGPPGAACVKCHSDHNGANFSLLHWDPTPRGFDHSKTGFTLDGKHSGVACRSCHAPQHITPAARAQLPQVDLGKTWLGMATNCLSCHEDKHQGRFGVNCAQCHSTAGWKDARVDAHGFDHSKTHFALTGMHQKVACEKCHTPGSDGQPRFAGIQFATCAVCHSDPHKGAFKQGCESCHTTLTWKKSSFVSTFDHSKTAYPLAGKHLDVACLTCHKGGDFKTPIPHNQCADCHKQDPHSGQFAKRADGGKCESCHTVSGFKPSTFATADHARTGFPLNSPHALVKCADCHTPAGPQTRFKIKFALCIDCHQDPHKGQFAGDPWQNQCQKCHSGLTFKKQNMTLLEHQKTRFPLTGGHVAVACIDCHKPVPGSTTAVFHFANLTCTTCHEDIHHGEFAARMSVLSNAGKPLGCEACHSNKDWKDIARFDHASTHFPLEGSHRAVACIDCHKPPNLEQNLIHVQFSQASSKCVDCHQSPHGGQFKERELNCSSCHNSNKWRPSLFDHEKTSFSLKGGHQDVRCAACHTNKKSVEDTMVLLYKPTPSACADCHGTNIPAPGKQSLLRIPNRNPDWQQKTVAFRVASPATVNHNCFAHQTIMPSSKPSKLFVSISLPSGNTATGIAASFGRAGSNESSAMQPIRPLRKNASSQLQRSAKRQRVQSTRESAISSSPFSTFDFSNTPPITTVQG